MYIVYNKTLFCSVMETVYFIRRQYIYRYGESYWNITKINVITAVMLQYEIMLFSQHCLLYTENRTCFMLLSSVVKQILNGILFWCFFMWSYFILHCYICCLNLMLNRFLKKLTMHYLLLHFFFNFGLIVLIMGWHCFIYKRNLNRYSL